MLLDGHHGTPHAATMSKLQAKTLVAEIGKAGEIPPDVRLSLASEVLACNWSSLDDSTMVLAELQQGGEASQAKRSRRCLQDFKSICEYLSEGMWHALQDPGSSPDSKLSALLQHAMRLGMRTPSEPTVKLLTSLWIIVAFDAAAVNAMDSVHKVLKYKHVKGVFDTMRRKAADPVVFIEALPAKPVDLLRDSPLLYKAAFSGGQSPAAPPAASMEHLHAIDMSYACRGGLKGMMHFGHHPHGSCSSGSGGPVPMAVGGGGSGSGLGGFENVAMMFMQRMETMASQQQRLVEMVTSGGTAGGGLSRMASVASLEDRAQRPFGLQMLPPMVDPATPRMAGHVEMLPDSPPAVGTPPPMQAGVRPSLEVFTPPPLHADTPPPLPPPLQAAAPQPASGVDNPIENMLAALTTRNAETRAAATAKAKAKAMDAKAAAAPPPPPAKAAAAAAKCKAKGKAKGKAKAVGGGVPLLALPPPAAALPPPAKAGKAKAHKAAKAKEKAVGKVGGPPGTLGCAKCRWTVAGCAQCKNPDFRGFRWNAEI